MKVNLDIAVSTVPVRPTLKFTDRFELELSRNDPKDGELLLITVKPAQRQVEADRSPDVQIGSEN